MDKIYTSINKVNANTKNNTKDFDIDDYLVDIVTYTQIKDNAKFGEFDLERLRFDTETKYLKNAYKYCPRLMESQMGSSRGLRVQKFQMHGCSILSRLSKKDLCLVTPVKATSN